MPELPEVETIVNQLHDKVVGKKIVKAEVFDKIAYSKIKNLSGLKFKQISRRAKYIIMALDDGHYILTHLNDWAVFLYSKSGCGKQKKNLCSPPYRFISL